MKNTWLKQHWNLIYLIPLICGISSVLISCLFNPVVVERYISSDHHLEGRSIKNIYLLEVFTLFIGLALILLSRFIRNYSQRKEKIVANFLILCCSTAFTLMLLEVGLKMVNRYVMPFNKGRHAFFQYDEVLGWTHKPNKTSYFKNARVQINAKGLRDEDIPYQKPDGEFRMLLLGDSQLFGDGVWTEETSASLLEKAFHSVQAINAGIIGYGTDQQLLFLKKEGVKYSPDLIIVTLNAYDFQDNISKTIRSGYSKPLFKIEGGELLLTNVPVQKFDLIERLNRRLSEMSHLYYLTSSSLGSLANRKTKSENQSQPNSILPKGPQMKYAMAVTKHILKEIAKEGRKVNAKTIVIFLPYQMDFGSDETYKHQTDNLCRELSAYSQENDFFFLDIRPELAAGYQANTYRDTMHFGAEGHRIVAEILSKNLIGLHLIPKAHRK